MQPSEDAIGTAPPPDGDDEHVGVGSWALNPPETYSIASLALAIASIIGFGPGALLAEAIFINGEFSARGEVMTSSGVGVGICVVAIVLAWLAVRTEDEDSTWSPPIARAALVVALLAGVLALSALVVAAATTPNVPGFTSPSS
jgi:hypothetical protein